MGEEHKPAIMQKIEILPTHVETLSYGFGFLEYVFG